jgi:hypothetical protein
MVDLEDPKWDSGLLGRVVHNVIQKDWDLKFLPGVVPKIVVGFR